MASQAGDTPMPETHPPMAQVAMDALIICSPCGGVFTIARDTGSVMPAHPAGAAEPGWLCPNSGEFAFKYIGGIGGSFMCMVGNMLAIRPVSADAQRPGT